MATGKTNWGRAALAVAAIIGIAVFIGRTPATTTGAPAVSAASSISPLFEPDAKMNPPITADGLKFLVAVIRASGWQCDSVSRTIGMVTENGATVYCNQHRYSYDVWDRGGRWVAQVK